MLVVTHTSALYYLRQRMASHCHAVCVSAHCGEGIALRLECF